MSVFKSVHLQRALTAAMLMAVVAVVAQPVSAQSQSGPPNALQGFSQNRDKPVQIDAASLEVRDRDKMATFLGNVRMMQGDTTLRCRTLVVFYDQDATPGTMTAAKPGPGGQQQIKRLEAKGDVIVTQKDQVATGDNGTFDMKSNTVTLFGSVVVTQGQNVLKGDRLVVDLTTGVSHVEAGKEQRVRAIINQGSGNQTSNSADGKSGSLSTGTITPTNTNGREPPKAHPAGPTGLY
jgi:lipopolysaccharide export system protein LptA